MADTPRPRLLDLFCGAGGAGEGYRRAGFDVVGVDLLRKSTNPHPRIVADVMDLSVQQLRAFDAIHASPPCQRYAPGAMSKGTHLDYPDLIDPVRQMLDESGRPYVIENIPTAPLLNAITLCGSMFTGLRVRRHRLFESNILLMAPPCGPHQPVVDKTKSEGWRALSDGTVDPWSVWLSVTGNPSPLGPARDAMGIPWMTGKELSQAIPPAYTEFIGRQLLDHV